LSGCRGRSSAHDTDDVLRLALDLDRVAQLLEQLARGGAAAIALEYLDTARLAVEIGA